MTRDLVCSSHTISGVMPGDAIPARHSFEARVAACAAVGYRRLCLHLRDYRELREAGRSDGELVGLLRRHGMTADGVEFLTDWFLEGGAGEPSRRDEKTAYAAAHAYGARMLNVGADFAGRNIPRAAMKRRFQDLCERAGENGLRIALEIVPWSDVADPETALDMIDGVVNAGLVIDAWHVFRGGISLRDIARIPGDRIFCVQISDATAVPLAPLPEDTRQRKPCGEGALDLAGFLASVASTGTTAPVSVEIISPEFAALDVETAARVSIAGARRLIDQMDGLNPAFQ